MNFFFTKNPNLKKKKKKFFWEMGWGVLEEVIFFLLRMQIKNFFFFRWGEWGL